MNKEDILNKINERSKEIKDSILSNKLTPAKQPKNNINVPGEYGHIVIDKTVDTFDILPEGIINITLTITFDADYETAYIGDYFGSDDFVVVSSNLPIYYTDSYYIIWEFSNVTSNTPITIELQLKAKKGSCGLKYFEYQIWAELFTADAYYYDYYRFAYAANIYGCANVDCCNNTCKYIDLVNCSDSKEETITISNLTCIGRLLELSLLVDSICPRRKLALGIFLEDITSDPAKKIGFKIVEVPAQIVPEGVNCIPVQIDGICFPIPGDICDTRNLRILVFINYLDFDLDLPNC